MICSLLPDPYDNGIPFSDWVLQVNEWLGLTAVSGGISDYSIIVSMESRCWR
jgi:hypothetical protein